MRVREEQGEGNLTNDTPRKKGFWTPLRLVRFPPPSVFFLVLQSKTEQTRSSCGGGEFSDVFFSHTFCIPQFLWPKQA